MKTVRLWTGKIGPIDIRIRPAIKTELGLEYGRVINLHSSLENGCRMEMPVEDWEAVRDQYVDRDQRVTYKDAFVEL